MPVTNPYSQYMDMQVTTASPGKLLIMIHDAAIRFGSQAMEGMKASNLEQQSTYIRKMQNVLVELMGSLNPDADPKLAGDLDSLYTYMFDRLTHANLHDDQQALEEIIGIFAELRETWVEADASVRGGGTAQLQGARAA